MYKHSKKELLVFRTNFLWYFMSCYFETYQLKVFYLSGTHTQHIFLLGQLLQFIQRPFHFKCSFRLQYPKLYTYCKWNHYITSISETNYSQKSRKLNSHSKLTLLKSRYCKLDVVISYSFEDGLYFYAEWRT